MFRGLSVLTLGLALVPGGSAVAWEVPAPIVSPGEYGSKTYTTTFRPGEFEEFRETDSDSVLLNVMYRGRAVFSKTFTYDESWDRNLYPGNYVLDASRTVVFKPSVRLERLTEEYSDAPPFSCTITETSRTPVYYASDPTDLNYVSVDGTVTCSEAGTGRTYVGSFVGYEVYSLTSPVTLSGLDNAYEMGLMSLITAGRWTESRSVPFTVKASNGPTVTYDEYSRIKKGMTRKKVESIFGNSSGVFYRRVSKGRQYVYDSTAFITYKNNKVTAKRYDF